MSGKSRVGRRYSLRVGDDLFAPADLSDLSEEVAYNPNNLNAPARKVAARVARVLGQPRRSRVGDRLLAVVLRQMLHDDDLLRDTARPPAKRYLDFRFDVTDLSEDEIGGLWGEVAAQAERSERHPSVEVEGEIVEHPADDEAV